MNPVQPRVGLTSNAEPVPVGFGGRRGVRGGRRLVPGHAWTGGRQRQWVLCGTFRFAAAGSTVEGERGVARLGALRAWSATVFALPDPTLMTYN